jgi:hypothetical protein
MRTNSPNQSLEPTVGRRDDHIYFYETVLDVCHARSRQRWLSAVSLGLVNLVATALAIVLVALAFAITRLRRRDQRVLRSLSAEDRQFIADQFEPFTRLPLGTAEDEDAWQEARHATFERLGERVPDFAREVLPRVLPYFNDADIFRREPDYRATQERRFVDFIHELRAQPTKT